MSNRSATRRATVQQRRELLLLARQLGNIAEACRRLRTSRTQYYKFAKRLVDHGEDGLKDLRARPRPHPNKTGRTAVNTILNLSRDNPNWSCGRLSAELENLGVKVSSPVIQKILLRNRLGTRRDRWSKLEFMNLKRGREVTPEQLDGIVRNNPRIREREREPSRPGALLHMSVFRLPLPEVRSKTYVSAAIDVYSSYAFAHLQGPPEPDSAIILLNEYVLPTVQRLRVSVDTVVVGDLTRMCGGWTSWCLSSWPHAQVRLLRSVRRGYRFSGFFEHFRSIVLRSFPHILAETRHLAIDDMIYAFEDWLDHFNRRHFDPGYPCWHMTHEQRMLTGRARQSTSSDNVI